MGLMYDICKDNGISLKGFTCEPGENMPGAKKGIRGFGAIGEGEGKRFILFDKTMNPWCSRYTIALELAHHLFGICTSDGKALHLGDESANIFASVFTALMLWEQYHEFDSQKEENHG